MWETAQYRIGNVELIVCAKFPKSLLHGFTKAINEQETQCSKSIQSIQILGFFIQTTLQVARLTEIYYSAYKSSRFRILNTSSCLIFEAQVSKTSPPPALRATSTHMLQNFSFAWELDRCPSVLVVNTKELLSQGWVLRVSYAKTPQARSHPG